MINSSCVIVYRRFNGSYTVNAFDLRCLSVFSMSIIIDLFVIVLIFIADMNNYPIDVD